MSLDREFVLGLKRNGKYSCPNCQHQRTKNKRDTPLSVTIKEDCVVYYCHHCNCKGAEFYERHQQQRTSVRKQERVEPENLNRLKNRVGTRTIW